MATDYFNLPTVNEREATFSFVDSVNALATSVDASAEEIRKGFNRDEYVLPIATRQQLGGVRVGDGWDLYSDGMIRAQETKYTLPAATDHSLGGIIAGENITCDPATGTIGVDEKAYDFDAFNEQQLADGCMSTNKFIDGAVSGDKLATDPYSKIQQIPNLFNNPTVRTFNLKGESDMYSPGEIVVTTIGNVHFLFWRASKPYGQVKDETCTIEAASDGTEFSSLVKKQVKLYLMAPQSTDLAVVPGSNDNWYGFNGKLKYGELLISPGDNTAKATPHNGISGQWEAYRYGHINASIVMVTKE